MDSQRFDALTRRWSGGSRRQVLSALVAGLLGHVVRGPDVDEVAAACKGFNAKCTGNASCCAGAGLRCVKVGKGGKGKKRKRRCRCKGGTCPPQTPCCIGGKCQELCDGECCADCFVELSGTGEPIPSTILCCPQDKICGPNPKKLSDDRCCFPNEDCVGGECCNNTGAFGSVVCGGKCCSVAACCNGACCGAGQVCATTPQGDTCVSASRECGPGEPACFTGEDCHGGVCCPGERICSMGAGADVCCAADERCELPDTPQAVCCPINTTCNSFKGHRVRR